MDDQLSRYRQSIDNIDAALVYMLAERFKVTKAVGELKAREGLPPADPGREERQIERLRELARDADLDPDFTEKFLRFIINEVIRHHQQAKRELIAHIENTVGVKMTQDAPLICFARRMTGYKRPDLLFSDLDRLRAMASSAINHVERHRASTIEQVSRLAQGNGLQHDGCVIFRRYPAASGVTQALNAQCSAESGHGRHRVRGHHNSPPHSGSQH